MIDAAQPPMTLRGAATVIVRRRVTVLVVLTFCVAASIGLVLSTQRLYRADALALVRSASSGAVFSGSSQSSSDARRRIANEISVLEGVDVRQRVRDDLGLWSLPPRVTGTSSTTDDLVTIRIWPPNSPTPTWRRTTR
jgi:uncharacterized protein involved in exopolysaccharide biosynthesis